MALKEVENEVEKEVEKSAKVRFEKSEISGRKMVEKIENKLTKKRRGEMRKRGRSGK